MSLAVVFKSPEGLVLAADSRVTVTATLPVAPLLPPAVPGIIVQPTIQVLPAYFDNATKLLSVANQSHVGFVTYGAGAIGQTEPRTAHSFLPEFESFLSKRHDARIDVNTFAKELGLFFSDQWKDAKMPTSPLPPGIQSMVFLVAGYDKDDAYGKIFEVVIPDRPEPVERQAGTFGIVWGGQSDFLERLLNGFDPSAIALAASTLGLDSTQADLLRQKFQESLGLSIPYQFLPLQDCLEMATFLVSLTSQIQTWMIAIRGVGGHVNVATVTRTDGFSAVSQKRIHSRDDY